MERLSRITTLYETISKLVGPEACGDFVMTLSDDDCHQLYNELIKLGLNDRMVRPIWYDYDKQEIRAWAKTGIAKPEGK